MRIKIGDEGAQALAEALHVNQTLTSLDLHQNQIGVEGAQAIAEATPSQSDSDPFRSLFEPHWCSRSTSDRRALRLNQTLTTFRSRGLTGLVLKGHKRIRPGSPCQSDTDHIRSQL